MICIRSRAAALCLGLVVGFNTEPAHGLESGDRSVAASRILAEVRLTTNSAESNNPRTVVDGQYLYITWEDTRDGNREIYWQKFTRSTGSSVAGPVRVTNSGASSIEPSIGVDASGSSYVVWQEGTLYGTITASKIASDGTIAIGPTTVSPSVCLNPDIAVRPDGTSWIVFERKSASDHDVYIREFSSQLVQMCERKANEGALPPDDKSPAVIALETGAAYVLRYDLSGGWTDGIYSEAVPLGCGSISGSLLVSGDYSSPSVGLAGAIAWKLTSRAGNVYLLSGSTTRINDVSGKAGEGRVADDPNFAYCAWVDTRDGHDEIYLSKASGSTSYTDDRLTSYNSSKGRPDIASVNTEPGSWWVVWPDSRDGNWEIYMTTNVTPPGPHITVNPTALSFQAQRNAPVPASQAVVISNSGGGTLDWAISKLPEATWLAIDPPASGSGNNVTITIHVTTTDLDPQTYSTVLDISSTIADNSPQHVNVTYQVDAGPIDPGVVDQKQDIINYFTAIPFYANAESDAQTFLNGVKAHVADGTVTQDELEAALRLLVMEEAAKLAYWSSDEANVPGVAELTARCTEKAALEALLEWAFGKLAKSFERWKDNIIGKWPYRAITRAKEFFAGSLQEYNSAVATNVANRLVSKLVTVLGYSEPAARVVASDYAWQIVGASVEEFPSTLAENATERWLVDPLARLHLRIYESGITGSGGTQSTVTQAVAAAENRQFQGGQGQAAAGTIRNIEIPQIVADNTDCVAAMNTAVKAGEYVELAQLFTLIIGLASTAAAVLVAVLLCTATMWGCVVAAIHAASFWGIIAQIQTALTWVKVALFAAAAALGTIQLHVTLPFYLDDAQHTAFEEIQQLHIPSESVASMVRYEIPQQWSDSLAAASAVAVGRLTTIREDIAADDWAAVQTSLDGLDSALQHLSEMTAISSSVVGNTYLVNRTDSSSEADSALSRALAHASSVDASVALTQLSLGLGVVSQPEGASRDSVLITIDSCVARLNAVAPAYDSTLLQFGGMGYTAPAMVVITSAQMPPAAATEVFKATIKNISEVPVHNVKARLSEVSNRVVVVQLSGDTSAPSMNPGEERFIEWKIERDSVDTLFQLELRITPDSLPGDFIGDNRLISFAYPFNEPCCTGTTGNVDLAGIVDVSDLSLLVAYLTVTPPPALPCPDEANVNALDIIDISDLSLLVSYLTASPPPALSNCP